MLTGCAPVTYIGVQALYEKTPLPESQIVRDICYSEIRACSPDHRLDLYLPQGENFPTILFVHGGGWTEGDKNLVVGGADVYGNIGRYYAAHGMAVAVVNYRLQPKTDWRGQTDDVKAVLRWARANIERWKGRPDQLFFMGHSAGTHLASYAALTARGADQKAILGVIAVSGAGLDLTDRTTYDLGEDPVYYEKRFRRSDESDEWTYRASPVSYVTPHAPPFLILYASNESKGLQRQSWLLNEALENQDVATRVVVVPGESHQRIVLTLSRDNKTSAPAILEFIYKATASTE